MNLNSTPTRPILRYHGGKWKLADWIISHMPTHKVYLEPFGGAGSVLLKKPRSYAEVYNDLDHEVVNLFRVVRCQGEALKSALQLTPYSRAEFEASWYPSDDPLEQARRTVVRSFMGFGSAAVTLGRLPNNPKRGEAPGTGFRSNSNRSGTTPSHDWANYPCALEGIIARLQGVVIENRPAESLISTHDSTETLIYADPPYVSATRDPGNDYAFEMTEQDHIELAQQLNEAKGMVLVSGYASELYDRELFSGWYRVERAAHADGAAKRTEVLWLNKKCAERIQQPSLFNQKSRGAA